MLTPKVKKDSTFQLHIKHIIVKPWLLVPHQKSYISKKKKKKIGEMLQGRNNIKYVH